MRVECSGTFFIPLTSFIHPVFLVVGSPCRSLHCMMMRLHKKMNTKLTFGYFTHIKFLHFFQSFHVCSHYCLYKSQQNFGSERKTDRWKSLCLKESSWFLFIGKVGEASSSDATLHARRVLLLNDNIFLYAVFESVTATSSCCSTMQSLNKTRLAVIKCFFLVTITNEDVWKWVLYFDRQVNKI